jgi:hypothetical protein
MTSFRLFNWKGLSPRCRGQAARGGWEFCSRLHPPQTSTNQQQEK